jgi:hypothetical protein
MQSKPAIHHRRSRMAAKIGILLALCPLLLTSIAFGQQTYVGRYDVYTGFMYLNSSAINLGEPGFHTQIGIRPTHWYSLGFDFSTGSGTTALTPNMLTSSLQQQLAPQLAQLQGLIKMGLLPANYKLAVPLDSSTQTYTMGPQLAFRHFKAFTIFVRPDLGAMHETAKAHPADPITKALVAQLAPSATLQDWTYFYGFGGGLDLNVTAHFSLRVQADFVRDHLFNDLLNARNSVRFSIGPGAQWGRNMAKNQ